MVRSHLTSSLKAAAVGLLRAPGAFPFGKAPFWILVLAVLAGGILVGNRVHRAASEDKPDLVFLTFAQPHYISYLEPLKEFQRTHGVKIRMELVSGRALESRLQSAMLAGAEVPDVVEIEQGTIHYFIRGPLQDVGFRDITDDLIREGYYDPAKTEAQNRLVGPRLSIWMSRGRIFALPHDVHPVCLAYRADVMDEILAEPDIRREHPDIRSAEDLDTWDKFVALGRSLTKDLNGDGIPDRYALDLASNGDGPLRILLLQRGEALFTKDGQVAFDSPVVADTVFWYIHQIEGPQRIAFPAGWGQTLSKAVLDKLVVFYFCPDWRTKFFQNDVPGLGPRLHKQDGQDEHGRKVKAGDVILDAEGKAKYPGKMRVIPLPAWEPSGRRTSVWGGTGLVITKHCKKPKLAWELCKFLYFDKAELGKRFAGTKDYPGTNIIPPFKDAWNLPEFNRPDSFFGNQKVGRVYAGLAPTTPPDYRTAYTQLAQQKLDEAFANSLIYYKDNVLTKDDPEERRQAEKGLRDYIKEELNRVAGYVRRTMDHNVFLRQGRDSSPGRAGEAGK